MRFYKLKYPKPAGNSYSLKIFLFKLIALFIAWQTAYHFILKPERIPDKFLTDILTVAVTACINFFMSPHSHVAWLADSIQPLDAIQEAGKTLLLIYDDCNGLDLIAIYIGFLILLPYSIKRKLVFSLVGFVAIMIGNIIRCVLLYWIYVHHRSYFEFNHHYIFTILMYLIIFCGWVLFTPKERSIEIH